MTIDEYVFLRYNNVRQDGQDHWDALAWALLAYPNVLGLRVFINWSSEVI